jgi:hypothetical protein
LRPACLIIAASNPKDRAVRRVISITGISSAGGSSIGTPGDGLRPVGSSLFLEELPLRFPLRSAAMSGDSILFLNSTGTASVMDKIGRAHV